MTPYNWLVLATIASLCLVGAHPAPAEETRDPGESSIATERAPPYPIPRTTKSPGSDPCTPPCGIRRAIAATIDWTDAPTAAPESQHADTGFSRRPRPRSQPSPLPLHRRSGR